MEGTPGAGEGRVFQVGVKPAGMQMSAAAVGVQLLKAPRLPPDGRLRKPLLW